MLDGKYMDKALRKMYNESKYHVMSQFNVSFGIVGEGGCGAIDGTTAFPCEPFTAGCTTQDVMIVRLYDNDEALFPADRRVIQCSVSQGSEEYSYWQELYADRERYNAEKERIAEEIKARIIAFAPELEGRLVLLSTYSPVTFTKWCGAYKGSYMSFFEKAGSKSLNVKNSVKGLSNVLIAGQWLTSNGGLPMAVTSGKFAADALSRSAQRGK